MIILFFELSRALINNQWSNLPPPPDYLNPLALSILKTSAGLR